MTYLAKEAQAVIELKAQIAAAGIDDPELIADCIEGQTEFREVLQRLLDHLDEAEGMEAVLAERIKVLQSRKLRFGERAATLRGIIREGMLAADERRLVLPTATLSITPSRPSVIVTDESALPDECVKVTRSADKTAIRNRMEAGETIPGATLSNGADVLSIRRS